MIILFWVAAIMLAPVFVCLGSSILLIEFLTGGDDE